MKNSGLVIACISFIVCSMSVQAQQRTEEKDLFSANFQQLSRYLELTPVQIHEVYQINEMFVDEQKQYVSGSTIPAVQEEGFRHILYSNFKQLKDVLSEEQYMKYIALINLTYHNRLTESSRVSDSYLAMSPDED
ncbi:MAG: hypothetical protein LIP04_10410 [Tannerellaceae bacterium]|nr:hypothetical protein [Tannerellaceae bacterium]